MEGIVVVEYDKKYQQDFEQLNRAWIEKYFRVEPADEYVLLKPEENIINKGGAILFAVSDSVAIGTAGLRKVDAVTYELIKMAVHENFQGKGIGELLGYAALEKARELGGERVILYSNTRLKPALSLYRKLGFREIEMEASTGYVRSDIKMEVSLNDVSLKHHPYKMFI